MEHIVIFIAAYLIGCVSPSYIAGKIFKNIDIRDYGSGNAGTTNVLRQMGRKYALVVFIIDFLKGFLTVFFVRNSMGLETAVIAGIFVVIGHDFPLFLKFKGGKGAASTIGIYLCLFTVPMIISIIVAIILLKITKYVSLSSMVVTFLVTPLLYLLNFHTEVALYTIIYTILIVFTHRENIKRLLSGTERKIGKII